MQGWANLVNSLWSTVLYNACYCSALLMHASLSQVHILRSIRRMLGSPMTWTTCCFPGDDYHVELCGLARNMSSESIIQYGNHLWKCRSVTSCQPHKQSKKALQCSLAGRPATPAAHPSSLMTLLQSKDWLSMVVWGPIYPIPPSTRQRYWCECY
jgi:hypothetical protein